MKGMLEEKTGNQEENVNIESIQTILEPKVISIQYDKDKNDVSIRQLDNPFPEFFGTSVDDSYER